MTLAEIRQSLDGDRIKKILAKYDVTSVFEGTNYIIFPTCCHNVAGGSSKLYYYKNSNLFKCFTECSSSFDIFELIIKIEKIRLQRDITLYVALRIAEVNTEIDSSTNENCIKYSNALDYMYQFTHSIYNPTTVPEIDNNALNASIFNTDVLNLWEQEGISLATMKKYKIGYNPIDNCITIPIYDKDGRLISIRGRFLAEEETVKYKPISFCNKILSAPSSQILYGLYQTQHAIKQSKTAIIFESEKSVLMMDTYYGNKNNSVATLGKNISNQHIVMLRQIGAENIILAYDADYKNDKELKDKFIEYQKIAKNLATFFNVSIIIDWYNQLPYKASPIDCGKAVFEKLLEKRYNVKF
jgi:hypothetical protein